MASSLAVLLQISVESLSFVQGPLRFEWPFARLERLDLKTCLIPALSSGVGNHTRDFGRVRLGDQGDRAQMTLGLGLL